MLSLKTAWHELSGEFWNGDGEWSGEFEDSPEGFCLYCLMPATISLLNRSPP